MKMNRDCINFVLTGDKNYVMQLGVTITSIMRNLSPDRYARFFIFETDFTEQDKEKMHELSSQFPCEIVDMPMEKYLFYFKEVDTSTFKLQYVNLVCYYRLLMLDILPSDVDKCFYIDGDMIVDTDLSKIYDSLKDEILLKAVAEAFAIKTRKTTLKHVYSMDAFKNFVKAPMEYPYFNAGFLLFNIRLAKKLNLFQQVLDFMKKNPNPPYADQDILNALCGQKYRNKVEYLPPEYNVFCDPGINKIRNWKNAFYPKEIIKKSLKSPLIYHYAGKFKPWSYQDTNHSSVWRKYHKISLWKNAKIYNYIIFLNATYTFKLFFIFPILFVTQKNSKNGNIVRIKLFRFIPLCKIRILPEKLDIFLFYLIRIFIRRKNAKSSI